MAYAQYYLNDPHAPKPNRPVRLGVNVLLLAQGKLLLEYRRDSDLWGLIGGGVKGAEPECCAIAREVWEETGLRIAATAFRKLGVFDEPGRIVAYRDGTVRRMVTVLYQAELDEIPAMKKSGESRALSFFAPDELKAIPIAPTHRNMIALFAPNILENEEAKACGQQCSAAENQFDNSLTNN